MRLLFGCLHLHICCLAWVSFRVHLLKIIRATLTPFAFCFISSANSLSCRITGLLCVAIYFFKLPPISSSIVVTHPRLDVNILIYIQLNSIEDTDIVESVRPRSTNDSRDSQLREHICDFTIYAAVLQSEPNRASLRILHVVQICL